ncbi:MAG: tRNA pseudouridine(38-40) synthase TruA [Lactobacillus sp.]|nr:tRNA pseudouridine(38-40) synthase TruA [Lactobacillus sp.]
MRYKITIEYDGTNLLGWQKQLDGPSAQDFLEKAVLAFSGQSVEVSSAGRTDAGVHAIAQIAHFDIDTKLDCFRIREAMNAHLRSMEAPVCILEAEETSDDFHSRFSAKERGYIYRILNRRAPTVLNKDRVWWVPVYLDINKMQQAAKYLLGNHDFTSFRAAACQAQSPIKTLDVLNITSVGEEIIFVVEAKSFLHHQVRNIVGTLKLVGDGSLNPDDVKTILEAKDRSQAGATAPASGLYLNKVVY